MSWQEDWEWTLGFGKVEVAAILTRGFLWRHGDESSVEWSSREDGKREDLENRCLVKKGFYCKRTEENGWRAFAFFFFNMRESEAFFCCYLEWSFKMGNMDDARVRWLTVGTESLSRCEVSSQAPADEQEALGSSTVKKGKERIYTQMKVLL